MDNKNKDQAAEVDAVDDSLQESVGATLAAARKEKKLGVDEIADQLNLSQATIRAIENGHTEGLPELTYVRGYIRSYARLLGLDAGKLLESYAQNTQASVVNYDDIPSGSSDADILISESGNNWIKPLLILVALAIALFVWSPAWLEGLLGNNSEPQDRLRSVITVEPDRPVVVDSSVNDVASESAGNSQLADVESSVTKEADNESALDGQNQVDDTHIAEVLPPKNTLILNFEDTCWVDARDSDGTRLAYKSVLGGDSLELSSELELSIFLGNAEGVTATLNGESYDLSPYRQGVYAKFSISAPQASASSTN